MRPALSLLLSLALGLSLLPGLLPAVPRPTPARFVKTLQVKDLAGCWDMVWMEAGWKVVLEPGGRYLCTYPIPTSSGEKATYVGCWWLTPESRLSIREATVRSWGDETMTFRWTVTFQRKHGRIDRLLLPVQDCLSDDSSGPIEFRLTRPARPFTLDGSGLPGAGL